MPQASVMVSYGLTEAGPAYITMPGEEVDKRVGSVGKPMPPMEVRVVDPDTDEARDAGEVGELHVRLPGKRARVLQRRCRERSDERTGTGSNRIQGL
jgi:acyl-CoA synthetase (AMP-forming)/AMP-acid ligase II